MEKDPWSLLKKYTNARIALGRAGDALPTDMVFQLRMAHSLAKDALSSEIDTLNLTEAFKKIGLKTICVQSQVIDKNEYLRNPDKGKLLDSKSKTELQRISDKNVDLCIIVADGLSANAVNFHAAKLIGLLIPKIKTWKLSPIVLAKHSRVALSDAIGEIPDAKIALILIGERPGLSSPESMGAYLTYGPKPGNTDEKRNCISNIQPGGLSCESAAEKLTYLLEQMRTKQISGVGLKDDLRNEYLI